MRQIVPGAVGQFGPDVSWQIVGVIANERFTPFDDPTERPAMYVSYQQSPTPFQLLVVRSTIDVTAMREPVRKAVAAINREQALADVMTLDEVMAESESPDRLRTNLIGTFALVAMLLSTIGVYSVIAFTVGQRTREIGIRKALGASDGNLQWLIARDLASLAGMRYADRHRRQRRHEPVPRRVSVRHQRHRSGGYRRHHAADCRALGARRLPADARHRQDRRD